MRVVRENINALDF
jgi:hypothetical protein